MFTIDKTIETHIFYTELHSETNKSSQSVENLKTISYEWCYQLMSSYGLWEFYLIDSLPELAEQRSIGYSY